MAKVDWIRGHINPPENGEYYVIYEAQKDLLTYKKGDIEITTDYYHEGRGWEDIGLDNPSWKVVAWARVVRPDIPDHIRDNVKCYFGLRCEWKNGRWEVHER